MVPFFERLGSWVMGGLRRERGLQYAQPNGYAVESASPVTFDSAMQLSAVWACVKLLSETVASLPLTIYRVNEDGRKVANTHPLMQLFGSKVNRYQTRVEFFETMMLNLVMHGNAFARIERAGERITSMMPIMSSQVEVRVLDDGAVVYQYTHDQGLTVYAAESIWHLKLLGNGVIGLSPLAHQRNTLGIAQAAEGAVGKIYRNGAKPSGVLTIDRVLTPQQREQVRQSFATLTLSADDRLMVLEGGMKFDAISMTPQDIELLQSRQFQISEVCRWYGVPSVMVNDSGGTTVWGSGIEQIVAGFYKLTLRPLLEKIEASMKANLMSQSERDRFEVEFDFDALLRSDMKSRFESYRVGINAGLMTPNEARRLEGLPKMQGGDQLLVQGAMVPIDQAGRDADVAPADPDIADQLRMFELRQEIKSLKSTAPVTQAAPQITVKAGDITLHLPEMKSGDVHLPAPVVHMEPAQVHVEAVMPELKMDAPVVNVAPPNVTVQAPVVNVAPELKMGPRKTETAIARDSEGRITNTTQVERDA